ncbi:putative CAMK family protein kinase [Tritrichomonas foetus]|uniref:CAMK family protein kinase n=1 Tax=Tritrichomonas foetus TaxID=1144522 RepID=A0A1J4L155_9EUKA|nr:putative CAMK family protein kinase [Tritrichomonas foetus]|eukprot:OHT17146.1 putative CAMK family protein kinase [Tritrichomonas foetus]
MFLPDEYIPPKPLPLPFYSSPIDVEPIQYNVMKTLQQVGFNKDELIKELTSNGQNMAKVFYFMLIRLIDYTALPWHQANSGNTFLEPDQDETQLWTYDSLDSGIDFDNENCLSLAEKIDWDIGNKLEIDFKKTETITISGHSLAEIMYEMQEALVEFYYYYFHPDDQTLLATKDHETFIIINAELKEESTVSLKVNLFSGSDDDFDELIEKIREIVQDSLA